MGSLINDVRDFSKNALPQTINSHNLELFSWKIRGIGTEGPVSESVEALTCWLAS